MSPRYGLNETTPICFWCGKPKGPKIPLGKIDIGDHEDVRAPHKLVLDYEPCEACQKQWDKTVALVEVTETPCWHQDQLPLPTSNPNEKLYPTHRMIGVSPEFMAKIFNRDCKNGDRIMLPKDIFSMLFDDIIENMPANKKVEFDDNGLIDENTDRDYCDAVDDFNKNYDKFVDKDGNIKPNCPDRPDRDENGNYLQ